MMRVTQEKKLIGTRGVVVAVGDILEQMEPPDEDGLVSVKTASGETGMIKSKYLGQYTDNFKLEGLTQPYCFQSRETRFSR